MVCAGAQQARSGANLGQIFGNFSLIIGTLFGSDQLTMAEAQPEPQNRPEPRGANCQPSFLAAQAAMASGQMTGPLFEVGFSLENYHL